MSAPTGALPNLPHRARACARERYPRSRTRSEPRCPKRQPNVIDMLPSLLDGEWVAYAERAFTPTKRDVLHLLTRP